MLFSLVTVGGVTLSSQLISRSIFLSSLPADAIPYKYILPSLTMMLVMSFYTRIVGQFSKLQLMTATFLTIQISALVFRLLLETCLRQQIWFLLAMVTFFEIIGGIVMIQFWTFASHLFNTREAKRLFGLIAGGSALSSVLFGAILGSVAEHVETRNLIYIVVGSLVVSTWCIFYLHKKYQHQLEVSDQFPTESDRKYISSSLSQDIKQLAQSPMVSTMAGIIILMSIAAYIAEYQMDLVLKRHFNSDSQGMLGFLATLSLWGGIIATLLQLFITPRLLEKTGVIKSLFIFPATLMAGAIATLLSTGALWAVSIMRMGEITLKYTLNESAFNVLFLPISPDIRAKAKAVLDGIIKPPVIASLGLIFLSMSQFETVTVAT